MEWLESRKSSRTRKSKRNRDFTNKLEDISNETWCTQQTWGINRKKWSLNERRGIRTLARTSSGQKPLKWSIPNFVDA
jgi:hypothetical protein